MRPKTGLFVLVALSCSEIGLRPQAPDGTGVPDDRDSGVDPQRDPLPEICNGIDDDLDGLIDEGFRDIDDDGVADCIDEACNVAELAASAVDLDLQCIGWELDVEDPWNLVVEWNWPDAPSVGMPVVINLTDDDGDGDVDADDLPDIVVNDYSTGEIVALSPAADRELWRTPGFRSDAGISAADIDLDGEPEIVGVTTENRIRALNADGSEAWTSEDVFAMVYPVTTIADLDGDARPEVIADVGVVRGADGSTLHRLDLGRRGPWRAPVVADLDGDGASEILLGGSVFGADGSRRWSAPITGEALSAFPAVVQLDDDPMAEIAWAVGPSLHLMQHDGTPISEQSLSPRGRPGPPCAGDLDGDGIAEVIVPASDALVAFDAQGRERWSAPVRDSSGASGCIVFDMDGDAVYEVIYADMHTLYVFDGATGAVRYANGAHSSVTYFETPVVADVDGDGSAEIIVASSGSSGHTGITVFGHVEDGWPPAGPSWSVHDYYATNITDGGSVSTGESPGWDRYGLFRGRPATSGSSLPDLAVEIVDDCIASCEPGGRLRLSIQVRNEGQRPVDAGARLVMQGVEGKNRTLLREHMLPRIPPKTALATVVFDLPWTSAPSGGLLIAVDPDERVTECDEDDNEATWVHGECD